MSPSLRKGGSSGGQWYKNILRLILFFPIQSPPLPSLEGVSWGGREWGKDNLVMSTCLSLQDIENCHFLLSRPDLKLPSSVGSPGGKWKK